MYRDRDPPIPPTTKYVSTVHTNPITPSKKGTRKWTVPIDLESQPHTIRSAGQGPLGETKDCMGLYRAHSGGNGKENGSSYSV